MGFDKLKFGGKFIAAGRSSVVGGLTVVVSVLLLLHFHNNNVDCQLVSMQSPDQRANFYTLDLGEPSRSIPAVNYYTPKLHQLDLLVADLLSGVNSANGRGQQQQEFSSAGNDDLQSSGYLVQDFDEPQAVASLAARDRTAKLMGQLFSDEQLRQFKEALAEREQPQAVGTKKSLVVDDLNLHLPADNPLGGGLYSRPVNDPAEFEASMSQLTNKLNHELPNSQNRTAWLSNYLIDYYLAELNNKGAGNSNDISSDIDMDSLKTGSANRQILDGLIQQYLATRGVGDLEADRAGKIKSRVDVGDDDDNSDDELPTTTAGGSDSAATRYGTGSEYIDHPLALAGHQYVQGGAGEGRQLLGPEGTFENVQVVKSDHAVPAYCDPPNPCPIGYTAEDGCLDRFVNSASFSREYQAKQQCSCDNEHSLFNCGTGPAPSNSKHVELSETTKSSMSSDGDGDTDEDGNQIATLAGARLDTLARTIQNRFGDLATIRNLISKHENDLSSPGEDSSASYLVRSTRKWHQPIGDK